MISSATQSQSQGLSPVQAVDWRSYRQKAAKVDECFDDQQNIRPEWEPIISHFSKASPEQLDSFSEDVWRRLRENGVTYNIQGEAEPERRTWPLDPIPLLFSEPDWEKISAGLVQRAGLLDLVLKDFYGPRRLIKEGLIPQELVYRHHKFLRPISGQPLTHEEFLATYAANISRDSSGNFWVVNDYGEALDGAGYALENRSVIVGTLPDAFASCRVRRLASYFRQFKEMLIARSPKDDGEKPRIVLMSPGPGSPAYFEHAFLAAYLGIALVQSGDLTVRKGCVWLKSLGGLEQVDVIFRFVHSHLIDPLAIQSGTGAGVPGLVDAARQGNVKIINPVGAGAIENPGLYAFLPRIAKVLIGEDLILPNAATWWCGGEKELNYVLQNLDSLVIKSLQDKHHFDTTFCSQLSKGEISELRDKIKQDPALYVAQQQVYYSSAPSISEGVVEPRRNITRCFLTAKAGGGYEVMPGGLVKTAKRVDDLIVSSRLGAESKDAWVAGKPEEDFVSLWNAHAELGQIAVRRSHLPSRAGENLFWTGRYTSRLECLARTVRHALNCHVFDTMAGETLKAEHLQFLLNMIVRVCNVAPSRSERGVIVAELSSLLSDKQRAGSVPSIIESLRISTANAKDLWSADTRRVLNQLASYESLSSSARTSNTYFYEATDKMSSIITDINAFVGLSLESMTRDGGWLLLDAGRRIEQAQFILAVLIESISVEHPAGQEALIREAMLVSLDSLVTYRRTYTTQLRLDLILELMILDRNNPRSLTYQIDQLDKHILKLPNLSDEAAPESAVAIHLRELYEKISLLSVDHLLKISEVTARREGLIFRMDDISKKLSELASSLDQLYFRHSDEFSAIDSVDELPRYT